MMDAEKAKEKGKQPVSDDTEAQNLNTLEKLDGTKDELTENLKVEADGGKGVWVTPLTICPHVDFARQPAESLPRFDSLCASCQDPSENWVCLSCNEVLCGRYVGGHMMEHWQASKHPLALGYRDLSVWCFACEAYLDAQLIPELSPTFDAAHLMKFGEAPQPREGSFTRSIQMV
eukprot:jgi/Mesen1/281/ME1154371C09506